MPCWRPMRDRRRVRSNRGSARVGSITLAPSKVLVPADAAVAIIYTTDGRYLLQHRDRKPTIFYPDHWGCFGGAIDKGESPLKALRRELKEELALPAGDYQANLFSRFCFTLEVAGIDALVRFYYEVQIEAGAVGAMRLGEGAGMALVKGEQALHSLQMVPYDAFALWLHFYRRKLGRRLHRRSKPPRG
jgi:8-oxo-dGTP pyrophosphatase MutT (NUDIX family)